MAAAPPLSKHEYLKRYLSRPDAGVDVASNSGGKLRKKLPKPSGAGGKGMRIVDDDVSWTAISTAKPEKEEEDEGDLPVVAEFVDERLEEVKQMEAFHSSAKWRLLGGHDEDLPSQGHFRHDTPILLLPDSSVTTPQILLLPGDSMTTPRILLLPGESVMTRRIHLLPGGRVRHDTPDPSPPGKPHHSSSAVFPRRTRHDSPAPSPSRRTSHNSSDISSSRRSHHSSPDACQPRKILGTSDTGQLRGADTIPPTRHLMSLTQCPKPKVRKPQKEHSHLGMSHRPLIHYSRRRANMSVTRISLRHEKDRQNPILEVRSSLILQVTARKPDSDLSPPRRKQNPRSPDSDSDLSPPLNRPQYRRSDSDLSPPRRKRGTKSPDSHLSPPGRRQPPGKRAKHMYSGAKTGLVFTNVEQEQQELKKPRHLKLNSNLLKPYF